MSDKLKAIIVAYILGTITVGLIWLGVFVSCTPTGTKMWNEYDEEMIKADLQTNYKTSIETETKLRAYIASYESDRITYETNKESGNQVLADAAKTRANRTAAEYNNLLQHSLLQEIKFPDELMQELDYIK